MKSPEFVVHGKASAESVEKVKSRGYLRFEDGRETVSTDFFMALDFAQPRTDTLAGSRSQYSLSEKGPGSIMILKIPEGFRVDYGTENKIEVNDERKEVSGHVGKYSGGRRQLGIYREELKKYGLNIKEIEEEYSMEKASEMLGKDIAIEKKIDLLKKLDIIIANDQIVAEIKATPRIIAISEKIKDDLLKMKMSIADAAEILTKEIETENEGKKEPIHQYLDRTKLRKILAGLFESSLINSVQTRIRRLDLQIKMLDGYHINDKDKIPGVDFSMPDRKSVVAELDKIEAIISTPGFTTSLPTVDKYLTIYIPKLRERLNNIP